MIEIQNLSDLSGLSNFETIRFDKKNVIIYDDHRCVLTVLFEAMRLGLTDKETNLITFDLHDDAKPLHPHTDKAIDGLLKSDISSLTSRDFKSFVEFDISDNDDDWVNVGMELGLINHIVNIGCDENANIKGRKGHSYRDRLGREHSGYVLDHLRYELDSHGGCLGDKAIMGNEPIRHIFGYNPYEPFRPLADDANFVLDFDLDCFTTVCMGKRFAWPEDIFRREYGNNTNAGFLMNQLINKAKFITICREPIYCGGIGESNRILEYLDRYFFRGNLGTGTVM